MAAPAPAYVHLGSAKTFNGRAGTCHVKFLLAFAPVSAAEGDFREAMAMPRERERLVWEPFGKYYYALGAVTVAPAGAESETT